MTADTVGGVWTYALELAGALRPLGVQTALATMGAPLTPEQKDEAAAVPGLEVFPSAYKLEWMDDPWRDVALAGKWLLDLEATLRPDIVHLNGYAHGDLPWRAPTLMVGHSCVLSWWRAVRGEDAPGEWSRYRDAVTRGLHAADCVVAPTAAMLGELETHYGPLPSPARVIPNGRTADLFAPGEKQEFVLSAGRLWDDAKNLAALERVAPRLDYPVYVAGEQAHPEGGVAAANSVRPLGRLRPDVLAGWLAKAAVYVLPARYEPFGLSVLEAALAGCALVLGDIPSLRENWEDAAVFVSPDDTDALETAIRGLMHDPDRRREHAVRARARALALSSEVMAAGYKEHYDALLAPASPSVMSLPSFEVPACAS